MFAKSTWFGPSKENVIELDRLLGDPPLGSQIYAMVLEKFDISLFTSFDEDQDFIFKIC